MEIRYHPKFIKEYKKIPTRIKELSEEKELIFSNDPFDPQLKTHKLHGSLKTRYSFSINYQYRIIFSFSKISKNISYFLSIGKHNIYK